MNAVEEYVTEEAVEVEASSWQEKGKALSNSHRRHQWKIADWLIEGLALYPDGTPHNNASKAYDVAEKLFPEYTRGTFQTWVCVARTFGSLTRDKYPSLYFGHFKTVLGVTSHRVPSGPHDKNWQRLYDEETQDKRQRWLAVAEAKHLSLSALRFAINNGSAIENGELAPPTQAGTEPGAPPAKQTQPTKLKLERGYSLPLPHADQCALETLAVGRGISPAILAAHAVSEYLEEYADEIAGAAEQQEKRRAEIKAAEDARLAIRDEERLAHNKARKEQEAAQEASRKEREAGQEAARKEQEAAQEAARKEQEREVEEIWQEHVEPVRQNDYLFFIFGETIARLDAWRKRSLPSPKQMMAGVELLMKRVEELRKADELRQVENAQHVEETQPAEVSQAG